MFMDSYLLATGTVIGSIVTAIIVFGGRLVMSAPEYVYLGLGLGAGLLALVAVILMRRAYDASLLNWRLKRRQRGASTLDKLTF
jgi:hypothetical protein